VCASRRCIGGEILKADGRPIGTDRATGHRRRDARVAIRADLEGSGEIHLLGNSIDNPAGFRIDDHDVGEAHHRGSGPHEGVIDCVLLAVVGAVAGIVEETATLARMRIGNDIVVLQIIGSSADRQVVGERGFFAENAGHVGHEIGDIPVADLFAQLGRGVAAVDLGDLDPKCAGRVGHHLGAGKKPQFGIDRVEVGFDLACLGLPNSGELIEDRLFEGVAGSEITEHPRYQDRDSAQQDENRKQLYGQSPMRRASRAGYLR
jgi:hypothetical protein